MDDKPSLKDRLSAAVPSVGWPSLGRTVEIPVYVVHNTPDAEGYFFIFDFEQFVELSRGGVFVRPKLKVWAGRDDFDRATFARQFRTSFAKEFDAARFALAEDQPAKGSGWFGWGMASDLFGFNLASFAANVVLLVGVSAGKMVWNALPLPSLWTKKSDAAKLEQSIQDTQTKVDAALSGMAVTIHRELWTHAYKGTSPGRMTGMDKDAWPLPEFVRTHLDQETSTSWW